jgi:hypothetical protein
MATEEAVKLTRLQAVIESLCVGAGVATVAMIDSEGGWPWLMKQTKSQIAHATPVGMQSMVFVKLLETSISVLDDEAFAFSDIAGGVVVGSKRGRNKSIASLPAELQESCDMFNVLEDYVLTPETEDLRGKFSFSQPLSATQKYVIIYRELSQLAVDAGVETTPKQRKELATMLDKIISGAFLLGADSKKPKAHWCVLPILALTCSCQPSCASPSPRAGRNPSRQSRPPSSRLIKWVMP